MQSLNHFYLFFLFPQPSQHFLIIVFAIHFKVLSTWPLVTKKKTPMFICIFTAIAGYTFKSFVGFVGHLSVVLPEPSIYLFDKLWLNYF